MGNLISSLFSLALFGVMLFVAASVLVHVVKWLLFL
jgi:hypothetical protein